MTRDELIAFEADIAAEFNVGKIRAPIHLEGGNEDALIKIFKDHIGRKDWVCCSWRSHFKALLHGIPAAKVKAEIMAGRSIALCFPEHRFISSAIVGGILPIALGIAMSIKRNKGREGVFVFCGDMTAMTGIYAECLRYAQGHGLPITFIEENNGLSVCTKTTAVWGYSHGRHEISFSYALPWPHSGAGQRVIF